MTDIKETIADEAKRIVTGSRRSAYGTPEDNFERIARFWQAYFENTGRGQVQITAADISPMMRLMKEARICETPDHYDSHVDLVGYALTGGEVNNVTAPETRTGRNLKSGEAVETPVDLDVRDGKARKRFLRLDMS